MSRKHPLRGGLIAPLVCFIVVGGTIWAAQPKASPPNAPEPKTSQPTPANARAGADTTGATEVAGAADATKGDSPAPKAGASQESKAAPKTPAAQESKATPIPKAGAPQEPETKSADVVLLPDVVEKEGTVSVPDGPIWQAFFDGPVWQAFLKWLETQEIPAYNITSVTMEGQADDERTTLTARIAVQLNRPDEWVRIPLGMSEAHLLVPPVYQGDGEARPDRPADTGLSWWFKGKGNHELTLNVSVPFRASGGRRLQLHLPTPEAAVTSIKLRVPIERISVSESEGTWTKVRSLGKSGSEIVRHGLGTLLDLSWEAVPEVKRARTELRASTLIVVDSTVDSVTLRASQTIRASNGSFDNVTVQLPAGFDLVDVASDHLAGDNFDPDTYSSSKPNQIKVSLKEPTKGPVKLIWRLRRDFPKEQESVAIEGFKVAGALRQDGYIVIGEFEGYRISQHGEKRSSVQRASVSRLRSYRELTAEEIGAGQIASAYEFLKQPFRLSLNFERIEPNYRVEPQFFVKVLPDRADLEVLLRFHMYEGAVEEISLPWPAYQLEGWTLGEPESPELVKRIFPDVNGQAVGLRILLAERKTKHDGSFDVRFRASRPVPSDGTAFDMSLPHAIAAGGSPARLFVGSVENVEAGFTPKETTTSRPLSIRLQTAVELPLDFQGLRRPEFSIVDSVECDFRATVNVHEQQIQAETTILAEVQDDRVSLSQGISYDIAYEHLSQVRLLVPKTIEAVQFSAIVATNEGDKVQPLTPTWTDLGLEVEDFRQARLTLDEAVIGRFKLLAKFDVALPAAGSDGQSRPMILPVIRSDDAEQYSSMQFELAETSRMAAALDGTAWQQESVGGRSLRWRAKGQQTSIPLTFTYPLASPLHDFTIAKASLRTRFEPTGGTRSRAVYRVVGEPQAVDIHFAPGMVADAFFWDRQALSADRITEGGEGSNQYRIDVAGLGSGEEHHLAIRFLAKATQPFGLSESHELIPPQFAPGVRVTETFWALSLPYKQYLFVSPKGFAPQFRWERNLVFYRRVVNRSDADIDQWFGSEAALAEETVQAGGNEYAFSCVGAARPLAFRSMSQSVILTLGAGVALALGIVLLQISATRHVLMILGLAFAMAVCGLWYAEQIQLLLQPAVLGLLLAMTAAVIQNLGRRARRPSIVAVSPTPSDYVAPGSSVERIVAISGGSDAVTAYRPAAAGARQAGPSPDEGTEA